MATTRMGTDAVLIARRSKPDGSAHHQRATSLCAMNARWARHPLLSKAEDVRNAQQAHTSQRRDPGRAYHALPIPIVLPAAPRARVIPATPHPMEVHAESPSPFLWRSW